MTTCEILNEIDAMRKRRKSSSGFYAVQVDELLKLLDMIESLALKARRASSESGIIGSP